MNGQDAIDALDKMAPIYARHHAQVSREVPTMALVAALMKKWGESTLDDAIYREAKSRAIAESNATEGP